MSNSQEFYGDYPILAKWQTKGKDYLMLYQSDVDKKFGMYSYTGNQCGGGFNAIDLESAIAHMEKNQVSSLRRDRPSVKRIY